MTQQQSVIIAGSTGLIGSILVGKALKYPQIASVISVSRHALNHLPKQSLNSENQGKLIQIIDPDLHIDDKLLPSAIPNIGFITLGSTKKKAGSKEALKAVDVTLVVKVGKAMQQVGIESIYIVSCIGASANASSHYLKCKGEMEAAIEEVDFKQIVFLQPGPLAGKREEKRPDEWLLQSAMKLLNPIMKGRLLNYKPIEADLVASAMLHFAFQIPPKQGVQRITSQGIFALSI